MQLYLVDGARLRELREQTGLSQVELSLMIGQSDTWAEEMERESRVHVLEIIVQKLTRIFGVEISDLSTFPAPPVPTVRRAGPGRGEATRLEGGSLRLPRATRRAGGVGARLDSQGRERRPGL